MIGPEYSDLERDMVDYLTALRSEFPEQYRQATIGVGLPEGWTPSGEHLSVREDGSSELRAWSEAGALLETATVRVVAWASTYTRVKELARVARAAALRYPSSPALGVRASIDDDTRSPIASFTVTVRRRPI
ncbi:hypothetical protein [Nocardiopsis eucommiae]|uniref:hypothetical protein n=1 Tax=Nocardiopsis eucommiae TaxID=2831970 RepID=UPI003D7577F0